MKFRVDVVNVFDEKYEIRDGSGIGVGAPQFGERLGRLCGDHLRVLNEDQRCDTHRAFAVRCDEVGLLPVGTLVLWLVLSAVGLAGLRVPLSPSAAPAKEPPPVQAQVMHVELTNDRRHRRRISGRRQRRRQNCRAAAAGDAADRALAARRAAVDCGGGAQPGDRFCACRSRDRRASSSRKLRSRHSRRAATTTVATSRSSCDASESPQRINLRPGRRPPTRSGISARSRAGPPARHGRRAIHRR